PAAPWDQRRITMPVETIWSLTAFILTAGVIVSYLIGEKYPPFKVISFLFIGVAAGYAVLVVIFQVIYPRLLVPILYPALGFSRISAIVPLVLSIMLLFKAFPKFSRIGNLATGVIVGAAAGVIVGGAILGTLFAQTKATVTLFDPNLGVQPGRLIDAVFMLVGTVTTLLYFQFGGIRRPGKQVERSRMLIILAGFGKFFIAVTLGALLAGVISAAISVLAERLGFLVQAIQSWIR
ncbi:MAG TPA: hypothetical protein VF338_05145, partial [Leptolinea sp.]